MPSFGLEEWIVVVVDKMFWVLQPSFSMLNYSLGGYRNVYSCWLTSSLCSCTTCLQFLCAHVPDLFVTLTWLSSWVCRSKIRINAAPVGGSTSSVRGWRRCLRRKPPLNPATLNPNHPQAGSGSWVMRSRARDKYIPRHPWAISKVRLIKRERAPLSSHVPASHLPC